MAWIHQLIFYVGCITLVVLSVLLGTICIALAKTTARACSWLRWSLCHRRVYGGPKYSVIVWVMAFCRAWWTLGFENCEVTWTSRDGHSKWSGYGNWYVTPKAACDADQA